MNIPSIVKIGGKDYTVEKSSPLVLNCKQAYGTCDYDKQIISLDDKLQVSDGINTTLLHEILHTIANDREIDFKDGEEEIIINQFATGLYQVIKTNPYMFSKS